MVPGGGRGRLCHLASPASRVVVTSCLAFCTTLSADVSCCSGRYFFASRDVSLCLTWKPRSLSLDSFFCRTLRGSASLHSCSPWSSLALIPTGPLAPALCSQLPPDCHHHPSFTVPLLPAPLPPPMASSCLLRAQWWEARAAFAGEAPAISPWG